MGTANTTQPSSNTSQSPLDGLSILQKIRQNGGLYPEQLEVNYKRIFDRVVMRLGTKDLEEYLQDLMLPSPRPKDGELKRGDGSSAEHTGHIRKGFPQPVAKELFFLMTLNGYLLEQLDKSSSTANEKIGGSSNMQVAGDDRGMFHETVSIPFLLKSLQNSTARA